MCKSWVLAVIAISGLWTGAWAAQSVGIKFAADELNSSLGPNEVAGVFPQANWNNESGASGGPVQVVDADGNLTAITVNWISGNVWSSINHPQNNNFPAGPDQKLMSGYLDNTFIGTAINLSNVPANSAGYDLYVYTLGGYGGMYGTYQATSGNFVPLSAVGTRGATNPDEFILGNSASGDYQLFSGLQPDSGHLALDCYAGNPNNFDPINAIELVSLSGPIPEPAGSGTIAALALTLVARRVLVRPRSGLPRG